VSFGDANVLPTKTFAQPADSSKSAAKADIAAVRTADLMSRRAEIRSCRRGRQIDEQARPDRSSSFRPRFRCFLLRYVLLNQEPLETFMHGASAYVTAGD